MEDMIKRGSKNIKISFEKKPFTYFSLKNEIEFAFVQKGGKKNNLIFLKSNFGILRFVKRRLLKVIHTPDCKKNLKKLYLILLLVTFLDIIFLEDTYWIVTLENGIVTLPFNQNLGSLTQFHKDETSSFSYAGKTIFGILNQNYLLYSQKEKLTIFEFQKENSGKFIKNKIFDIFPENKNEFFSIGETYQTNKIVALTSNNVIQLMKIYICEEKKIRKSKILDFKVGLFIGQEVDEFYDDEECINMVVDEKNGRILISVVRGDLFYLNKIIVLKILIEDKKYKIAKINDFLCKKLYSSNCSIHSLPISGNYNSSLFLTFSENYRQIYILEINDENENFNEIHVEKVKVNGVMKILKGRGDNSFMGVFSNGSLLSFKIIFDDYDSS